MKKSFFEKNLGLVLFIGFIVAIVIVLVIIATIGHFHFGFDWKNSFIFGIAVVAVSIIGMFLGVFRHQGDNDYRNGGF